MVRDKNGGDRSYDIGGMDYWGVQNLLDIEDEFPEFAKMYSFLYSQDPKLAEEYLKVN